MVLDINFGGLNNFMFKYLLRRLALMILTLFGITLICFLIVNLAPGGPIERKMSQLRFGGGSVSENVTSHSVNEELVTALKKQYGFDKPIGIRYWMWLKNSATLNFGDSFIYEEPALDIIISKLPVSIQFGFLSFLLAYLISIPLGVYKAIRDGSRWDGLTSMALIVMYAVPPLVLGILLKTYFSGSVFVDWFPVGDLYSDAYFEKNLLGRFLDRTHHFVLPLICYTFGSFTILTFLMKNSMMNCIKSDYIRTARAKGLSNKVVFLKHSLKNALIPIVTGLGNFLQWFLGGSLIVEKIFNLDGIGLLGYESAVQRDIHVLLALILIQSVLGVVGRLMSDMSLPLVDPRITFSR